MAVIWITGVECPGNGSIGGAMDSPTLPGRVVCHMTESDSGDRALDSACGYIVAAQVQPHFLYAPQTDRLGQFGH